MSFKEMKLGGQLAYRILKATSYQVPATIEHEENPDVARGRVLLERHFTPDFWQWIRGKVVVDYGSGAGLSVVTVALAGAAQAFGLELQERLIERAQCLSQVEGAADKCAFLREPPGNLNGAADFVISVNSFEHYPSPQQVLADIRRLLKPDGKLLVSFSLPWKHPYGSHMHFLNPIPWLPAWFTEEAIMRLRADYVKDGATRFEDIEGGLNKMTISKFLQLAEQAGFRVEWLDLVPIKRLRWLVATALTREYFTSRVRARLVPSDAESIAGPGPPVNSAGQTLS